MLRISLHKISIAACYGLYEQEQHQPNQFEVDVDVCFPEKSAAFLDYVTVYEKATAAFLENSGPQTLEQAAMRIHKSIKELAAAATIRIAVRKLRPPINGTVAYAEICLEE